MEDNICKMRLLLLLALEVQTAVCRICGLVGVVTLIFLVVCMLFVASSSLSGPVDHHCNGNLPLLSHCNSLTSILLLLVGRNHTVGLEQYKWVSQMTPPPRPCRCAHGIAGELVLLRSRCAGEEVQGDLKDRQWKECRPCPMTCNLLMLSSSFTSTTGLILHSLSMGTFLICRYTRHLQSRMHVIWLELQAVGLVGDEDVVHRVHRVGQWYQRAIFDKLPSHGLSLKGSEPNLLGRSLWLRNSTCEPPMFLSCTSVARRRVRNSTLFQTLSTPQQPDGLANHVLPLPSKCSQIMSITTSEGQTGEWQPMVSRDSLPLHGIHLSGVPWNNHCPLPFGHVLSHLDRVVHQWTLQVIAPIKESIIFGALAFGTAGIGITMATKVIWL